jgi:hypothetical protein
MRLHVANCSKLNHDFIYWVPERPRPLTRPIAIGQQIMIEGDKTLLEGIVAQHARYGLVDIKDLDGKAFHGMAYSFDKPVPVERIIAGIEKNDEALQLAGDEIRKAAVIAADAHALATAQETGARLIESEAEIIEESTGPNDTGAKMKQTIVVTPEGQAPQLGKRGRGRPRKG